MIVTNDKYLLTIRFFEYIFKKGFITSEPIPLWKLPPSVCRLMIKNVTLRHLRCFIAVAEEGSFTNAAQRLSLTQSSLTATIRQLEDAVGVRLFDRTTRKVAMTQEAESFKPEAERLLDQFHSALTDLQAFSEGRQGHIHIAAAASIIDYFLADSINIFRQSYPHITFSLRDAGAEFVEKLVLRGQIDFAITSRHKKQEGLSYIPLLEDSYGVVCNPDHALARSDKPLEWRKLVPEGYIGFTADTGIGTFLRQNVEISGLFTQQTDEISSTTSLHSVLSTGPFYSIIPALPANTPEFRPYVFKVLEPTISRQICLITRSFRSLSPSARQFLQTLRETLKDKPLPPGARVLD